METTGNPSSVHAEGRAARRIVEEARTEVARLAGVSARCVTFVSGGTEAANVGAQSAVRRRAEAPAARAAHRLGGRASLRAHGPSVSRRGNRRRCAGRTARSRLARGRVPAARGACSGAAGGEQRDRRDPAGRRRRRRSSTPRAVSCSATRCRLAGRVDCGIAALGADALMLSAHKMGGPKGAGRAGRRRAEAQPRRAADARRRAGARRARRAPRTSRRSRASAPRRGACLAEIAAEPARLAALRDRLSDGGAVCRGSTRSSSATRRRGCPTRCASPFPASRPRR